MMNKKKLTWSMEIPSFAVLMYVLGGSMAMAATSNKTPVRGDKATLANLYPTSCIKVTTYPPDPANPFYVDARLENNCPGSAIIYAHLVVDGKPQLVYHWPCLVQNDFHLFKEPFSGSSAKIEIVQVEACTIGARQTLPSLSIGPDNIDCLPPYKSLGHRLIIFPGISMRLRHLPKGEDGTVCAKINKSEVVEGLSCYRKEGLEGDLYRCPLGTNCFSKGKFERAWRESYSTTQDQICINFKNNGDEWMNASVGVKLVARVKKNKPTSR